MSDPFLSIVVPAYNEAQRLGPSIVEIQRYLDSKAFAAEVILVDDGSTDGTADLLARLAAGWPAARAVSNGRNRGKGYTVRHGVLEARGQLVLFTDADLSAPIAEADKLIAALEASHADAAIGSRAIDRSLIGRHQPWFREFGGICFNWLVRLFTGLDLHDTQCGLKLFRRASTRHAFESQQVEGFGFDPELLYLIQRNGGKIVEVPVRWNDDPDTKVSFLRDSTRMFWELLALRWRLVRHRYPPTARSNNPVKTDDFSIDN